MSLGLNRASRDDPFRVAIVTLEWLRKVEKISANLNDAVDNRCILIALRILALPFMCVPTSLALIADLMMHVIIFIPAACYCRELNDLSDDAFMLGTLVLHLLTLGILSLIPILCSKLENPFDRARIEKMTPDQVSRISSRLKTYTTTINDSSVNITLAPTPLETLIACGQTGATNSDYEWFWNGNQRALIGKSRKKNRMIPATFLQTIQGETTQIKGTITPLEFAFLMKYRDCPLLIEMGAQLSSNPLPIVHSAILASPFKPTA